MNRYLIPNDYLRYITDVSVQQVISQNPNYQVLVEQRAQQKFVEKLSQKFDLSQEFTNTTPYNPASTYNATDRVYLNAAFYSTTGTYAVGALTMVANGTIINGQATNQVYVCTTASASPAGAFNPSNWQLLGNQYDMFYAITPYPVFDIKNGRYNVGDIVFWHNHTYTAIQQTLQIPHWRRIQYYKRGRVPFPNVFPDDPVEGPLWWKDNGPYAVPSGNLLTQNPSTYILFTEVRNNITIKYTGVLGGFINTSTYVDDTYAGWDFYPENLGFGTMTPGVDFNYYWLDSNNNPVISATNPDLLAIGFQLIGHTFNLNQQFVIHFQPIQAQTAPLNPYSSLSTQQIITTYFAAGDNRNQSVLEYYISMTLYYLHHRLSPKNIPDTRINAYKEAMIWLDQAKNADINVGLIEIQPPTGLRIRSGGNVKLDNSY